MIALALAVMLASLLGSFHCAGMCGAFMMFAVGATPGTRWPLHFAYHLGRLTTYTLLGAAAGAMGAAVDLGGSLIGLQRFAGVAAGAFMVVFGLATILRLYGVRIAAMPVPQTVRTLLLAGQRSAMNARPLHRAAAIGLLTTLLPCGWLYAFAVIAAGTASPIAGAVTMAAFWTGTLPVMATLGIGAQRLTGTLAVRLPMITATLIVVVGLYTVADRLLMAPMAMGATTGDTARMTAAQRLASLNTHEMDCCKRDHR